MGDIKEKKKRPIGCTWKCALVIGFNSGGGGELFYLLLQDGSFNQVNFWPFCTHFKSCLAW